MKPEEAALASPAAQIQDGKHTLKYFDDRPVANEATCGTLETLEKFSQLSEE